MSSQGQGILSTIGALFASPGIPITSAPTSASYWSAHNRGAGNQLLGYGAEMDLPREVDVLIIGAGITGAAVAHFLLHGDRGIARFNGSVALLEAREVSSGATGRNGGFVKPVPFRAYPAYKETYGMDEALQLVQSEYDNLELTRQLVEEGNIDAEFTIRSHREILLDEESAKLQKSQLDLIRADRHALAARQTDGVTWYDNTTEARHVTRSKKVVAAYTFDTGTMWPHKFVHGLLQNLVLSRSLQLFTRTPVLSISRLPHSPSASSHYRWTVQTPRGNISAHTLILATNAYTSTLIPSFSDLIIPVRSQMAAYTPPTSFSPPLEFTFGVRGGEGEGEEAYGMTTRDGTMVVGSYKAHRAAEKDGVRWEGETDDTVVFEQTAEYYRRFPRNLFRGWEEGGEGIGEGLVRSWTGIQGHTRDTMPFVGAFTNTSYEGVYVCAGFHGHGMARSLIAARGVVSQFRSSTGRVWDTRLPRAFKITEKRLDTSMSSREESFGKGFWEKVYT